MSEFSNCHPKLASVFAVAAFGATVVAAGVALYYGISLGSSDQISAARAVGDVLTGTVASAAAVGGGIKLMDWLNPW